MVGADRELFASAAGFPEFAGLICGLGTDGNSQIDSQSLDGDRTIGVLAATFACIGDRAGGKMFDNDRGVDFVSMLSARSATPRSREFALLGQFVGRETGWVKGF